MFDHEHENGTKWKGSTYNWAALIGVGLALLGTIYKGSDYLARLDMRISDVDAALQDKRKTDAEAIAVIHEENEKALAALNRLLGRMEEQDLIKKRGGK